MKSQEELDKLEFNDIKFVDAGKAVLRDTLLSTVATSHMWLNLVRTKSSNSSHWLHFKCSVGTCG